MSIFNKYNFLFHKIIVVITIYSCEEAEYLLDNLSDPENMDLVPPALFFHPPQVDVKLDTVVSMQVYGLGLLPASAAHLKIKYTPPSQTRVKQFQEPAMKPYNSNAALEDFDIIKLWFSKKNEALQQ